MAGGDLYDTLYAGSLLFALASAGLGALLCAYFLLMRLARGSVRKRLIPVANIAASFALIAMIFSVTVHLVFGHAAGSVAPMGMVEFFFEHRIYWLVALLALIAYLGPAVVGARH